MNGTASTLIRAAFAMDGDGVFFRPASVLIEGDRIIAVGTPQRVGDVADARVVSLPNAGLIPPLVNVHAHLDLTHIGPQRFEGSFIKWVHMVRSSRAVLSEAIAKSVASGIGLSRAGGVAVIGDIAGVGSLVPAETMARTGMAGVSFIEGFGIGRNQRAAANVLLESVRAAGLQRDGCGGVRIGIQPHAPYSAGRAVYEAAAASGLPISTHLAETLEELEFVQSATGPFADLLKTIGVWDESIVGQSVHPVNWIKEAVGCRPIIAAHLNYVDDDALEALSHWPMTVAYCPRASAYFGHPRRPFAERHPRHRYREMMDMGIRVALGTDSIIGLETPERISVLDEMCLLHQRDGVEPSALLRMATINGADALGFDSSLFRLTTGRVAGLLAVSCSEGTTVPRDLSDVLRDGKPQIQWVAGPFVADVTWLRDAP